MTGPSGGGFGGGGGTELDRLYITLEARTADLERQLTEAGNTAETQGRAAGGRFSGALQAGLGLAAGAATAVAGALVAAGAAAVNMASQATDNVNKFQSTLGVTAAEAERLGEVATKVFGNNFAGSMEEAGAAVGEVRKQFAGMADQELQKVTEQAISISDAFGTEVPESVSAAKTLMDQFGLTSQQAMDFLASGMQQGLDRSGDFLDTINEYSTQFSSGGASAEQFFSVLQTGLAGGALGTDKAADAFKEFRVRIQDGSKGTADALAMLGINAEDLGKKMASGQVTAAQAFQMVTERLAKTSDKTIQFQAGVGLLGTQFEDLGTKGATALSMTAVKMGDLNGATDKLNAQYNNLPSLFEGFKRTALVALMPVGQEILKLANEAMPHLQAAMAWLGERLPGWISAGVEAFRTLGGIVTSAVNVARAAFEPFSGVVARFGEISRKDGASLGPVMAQVAAVVRPILASLGPLFKALGDLMVIAFTRGAQIWENVLRPALVAMRPIFEATFRAVATVVQAAVTIVTNVLRGLAALMRGDFKGAADAMRNVFGTLANAIRDIVLGMAAGITRAFRNILPAMLDIGRQIVAGLVNGIRNGAGNVAAAARDMAGNAIEAVRRKFVIRSPSVVMFDAGEQVGAGLANGIKAATPYVSRSAVEMAQAAMTPITTGTSYAGRSAVEMAQQFGDGIRAGTPYVGRSAVEMAQAATEPMRKAVADLERQIAAANFTKSLGNQSGARLSDLQSDARRVGDAERYNAVTAEMERRQAALAAKTREAAAAAQQHADALKKSREGLENSIASDKFVRALRLQTGARLEDLAAAARQRGDATQYNAVQSEISRRAEAATAAQKRVTDAVREQSEALRKNRASLEASIAGDKFVNSLRAQTGARLNDLAASARQRGDATQYNAITGEMERRTDAVAAAQKRAADAARDHADGLRKNREALEASIAAGKFTDSLRGQTSARLEDLAASARQVGDSSKYNAVQGEIARRTEAVAAAQKRAADAARAHADQLQQNRERIASDRSMENFATALRSATTARVQQIATEAEAAGNLERYNAATGELTRRQDAATAATDRARQANEAAAKARADSIASLEDSIGFDKWTSGLRDLDDKTLAFMATEARAEGAAREFNAIIQEQGRRASEAADKILELGKNTTDYFTRVGTPASQSVTPWKGVLITVGDLQTKLGELEYADAGAVEKFRADLVQMNREGALAPGVFDDISDHLDALLGKFAAASEKVLGLVSGWELARAVQDRVQVSLDDLIPLLPKTVEGIAGFTRAMTELHNEGKITAQTLADVVNMANLVANVKAPNYEREPLLPPLPPSGPVPEMPPIAAPLFNPDVRPPNIPEGGASMGRGKVKGQTAELAAATAATEALLKAQEAWSAHLDKLREGAGLAAVTAGLRSLTDEELAQAEAAAYAAENIELHSLTLAEIGRRAEMLARAPFEATFKIYGIDSGLKQLDLLKDAFQGVADVISDVFADMVSGAEFSAQSVVESMALMALGIVKQVAIAVAAYQVQALALALISGASLNIPMAIAAAAAAAAIAGIAAGLETRIRRGQEERRNPPRGADPRTPEAPETPRGPWNPAPLPPTEIPNSFVDIPNSSVSVVAAPESASIMLTAANTFRDAVAALVGEGIRVRSEVEVTPGGRTGIGWDVRTI